MPKGVARSDDQIVEQAVSISLNQLDTNSRKFYHIEVFSFLPHLLEAVGTESCAYAAIRSNAIVNIANRTTDDMSELVTAEYHKALVKVQAAINDPVACLKDETLAAVWLMSKREIFVGFKGSAQYSYDAHYTGLLTLLQVRGPDRLQTQRDCQFFQFFLAPLNWTPLLNGRSPTQQYLDLEAQMFDNARWLPREVKCLHQYFHDVCRYRAQPGNTKLVYYLEEDLQRWCHSPLWAPKPYTKLGADHFRSASSTTEDAFSVWYFENWTGYFYWTKLHVARMLLHSSMLDNPAMYDIFHKTMHNFIGTLAYAVGDIDELGRMRPDTTPATNNGRLKSNRGVNVLGALQIHAPLTYLATEPCLTVGERKLVLIALRRLESEFRLW